MTFLLDTMMVSYFLQASSEDELASAAKRSPMMIVDEVRVELEGDPERGAAAFKRWLASTTIAVRAIAVGTPEAATLASLLSPAAPHRGRGERASIAVAAHDSSLTLVTNDKNGIWIAHRELWQPGERIIGVAVFLRRLVELGALTDHSVLDDVIAVACEPAQRPTWWASWRAAVAAASTPPPATST